MAKMIRPRSFRRDLCRGCGAMKFKSSFTQNISVALLICHMAARRLYLRVRGRGRLGRRHLAAVHGRLCPPHGLEERCDMEVVRGVADTGMGTGMGQRE